MSEAPEQPVEVEAVDRRGEIAEIERQIVMLHRRIREIRDNCPHPMTHRQQHLTLVGSGYLPDKQMWNCCKLCDKTWYEPYEDMWARLVRQRREKNEQGENTPVSE